MKILAVTCYTGGEELCDMTERTIRSLEYCVPDTVAFQVSVFAQGSDRMVDAAYSTGCPENVGFAFGMNRAVDAGQASEPDYVLCFNNDLEFPNEDWLGRLIREAKPDRICVPATDKSAIRTQEGPIPAPAEHIQEMSAYCWLIPFAWCQWLKEKHGFWLFDEEFEPCYGEDNWTAYLLAKKFGKTIFCYVRRSWVKHLKGRTSQSVTHNRRKTSAILMDKFLEELKDFKLRPDLRKWARRYAGVLRC